MMGVMKADPSHRSDAVPTGRSRSLGGVFVALGAMALLAGVALIFSGSAGAQSQDEARVDTASGSQSMGASQKTGGTGHTSQDGSGRSKEKAPRFNGTTCWEDLERFNENVTLGTFRQWAAPL